MLDEELLAASQRSAGLLLSQCDPRDRRYERAPLLNSGLAHTGAPRYGSAQNAKSTKCEHATAAFGQISAAGLAVEVGQYPHRTAARQQLTIDVDTEVAAILRKLAAEAHVTEGEILDRAIRAYDVRSLRAKLQSKSDLDEDQAMALAPEELKAMRAERNAAA